MLLYLAINRPKFQEGYLSQLNQILSRRMYVLISDFQGKYHLLFLFLLKMLMTECVI
jgi:hypothetical protein